MSSTAVVPGRERHSTMAVTTSSRTHMERSAGNKAVKPKSARMRLMTKGTPPPPSDEAMENMAESTEVSSLLSLAMVIVIAMAGPTPTAMPLTARSTHGNFCGHTDAGRQEMMPITQPPTTMDAGRGQKYRQMQGARAKRLTANSTQKVMLQKVAVLDSKPVSDMEVMSQVPRATSSPTERMAKKQHVNVKQFGSCEHRDVVLSCSCCRSSSLGSLRNSSEAKAIDPPAM
mmetsp:Transcript_68486/g.161118  ORF Transcript_68486/g.161118 Transcript_68486/m.161118 type:complete len:230 (+) Transcript_68486:388-1077(+)